MKRARCSRNAPANHRFFFLNFLYVLYFLNFYYFFGLDSGGTIPLFR